MKILSYNLATGVNCGSVEDPVYRTVLSKVEMPWSEANEAIAKAEAYNGEYTVADDGKSAFGTVPSQLDIIEAQVAYTAMMTDTLLEVRA